MSVAGVADSGTTASPNYDTVYALLPKGGMASVIDRLSFSAGGIALDSATASHSIIRMMKENLEQRNI